MLEHEIEHGDVPLAAAVHALKACAIHGSPLPMIGAPDPAELELVEREHAAVGAFVDTPAAHDTP